MKSKSIQNMHIKLCYTNNLWFLFYFLESGALYIWGSNSDGQLGLKV